MAAVVAAYAAGSWAVALPLGLAPRTHLPTCACADVAQEVWLLAVAARHPFALHTTLIDVPRGVGLLDNASFPLLGAVTAPLTRSAGPVASLVVLLRLAFFTSAVAAYGALRSVGRGAAGAAAGGALYAFSPFMTHQGASHFFLVFGPLPPLILAVVHRCLGGEGGRPWAAGVGVGLLAAAQFFVDSEVLILLAVATAVTVALGLGWSMLRGRPGVPALLVRTGALAGVSALVAAPFLAYPAWVALTGPDRLAGSTQANAGGVGVAATLFPGDRGVVAGLWPAWRTAVGQYLGHNSFVGVVLLAACALVFLRERRRSSLAAAAALFAAVAWVLQLGGHLTWAVRPTGVPLPFAVLQHLPVLQDIIPSRFSDMVDLGLAGVVAVGVDGLVGVRGAGGPARRRRPPGGDLVIALLLAAGLVLAAPDRGYGSFPIGAAASFASPGAPWAAVPAGALVLAYPIPQFPQDQAMLWQAEAGLRFRLVGGYAIRPGPGRRSDRLPLLPPPSTLPAALVSALDDPSTFKVGGVVWRRAGGALPGFLAAQHVRAVIVQTGAPGGGAVVALMRSRLGPPSAQRDGLALWLPGRG
ncbi:MAG: hypothetical protein ACYDEN_01080 [Acidimicrobiales bacterium]